MDEPVCVCGHASEEHSGGGPARTGYTRCEYDVNDWGASGCDQRCMEYMPDQTKCEHTFNDSTQYCDRCDLDIKEL